MDTHAIALDAQDRTVVAQNTCLDETVIAAKISEMRGGWDYLQLKTVIKTNFTPEQWVALARFVIDPTDEAARDVMPIKIADFTQKTMMMGRAFSSKQKDVITFKFNHLREVTNPIEEIRFKQLINDIHADFAMMVKVLFNSEVFSHSSEAGSFSKQMAADLHFDYLSFLLARVGLPFCYVNGKVDREASSETQTLFVTGAQKNVLSQEARNKLLDDGKLQIADDGGIYLIPFPGGNLFYPEFKGGRHGSSSLPEDSDGLVIPTPSFFNSCQFVMKNGSLTL